MKSGVAACALGLAISVASAAHAAGQSSVYCKAGKPALEFAGRIDPDGGLFFGLSIWDQSGDNSFLYGKADKRGDHWLYVSKTPGPYTPDRPCRLEIWYSERDGVRAKADPDTGCANHGSWNEASLSPKSRQGPVTVELDDPSNFFENPPGLLGRGACFKLNPE